MSDKKDDAADKKAAPPPARGGVNVVGLLATAVFAAAAAFGGARAAGARGSQAAHSAQHAPQIEPPGYTLALEPFLVMAQDATHHTHPMRVVLALEFDAHAKEETVTPFVPRIRDSAISHLRGISYEAASDPAQMDHLRTELLERFRGTGATGARRVLVTDLVVQ